MSVLSEWIVTVAGAVVLMHALEILMPDGEMARYVRGVLAVVCMFVIIAPLPSLFRQEISWDMLMGEDGVYQSDGDFLDIIHQSRADVRADALEKELSALGYHTEITLSAAAGESHLLFAEIVVRTAHTEKEEITAYIAQALSVEKELIRYG